MRLTPVKSRNRKVPRAKINFDGSALIGRPVCVLFAYNIEVFDILLVRFDRNTFELDDFHE